MKTGKNQGPGKQSTASTHAHYDRDAESLQNSATTTQNTATSSGTIGAGGVDEGEKAGTGLNPGSQSPMAQGHTDRDEDSKLQMRG
jgi:hypothetical protein